MDTMYLRLSKLALCLYLTHLCFDLGKRGKEHPTGKFGQLSFSFNFDHKDMMFV